MMDKTEPLHRVQIGGTTYLIRNNFVANEESERQIVETIARILTDEVENGTLDFTEKTSPKSP